MGARWRQLLRAIVTCGLVTCSAARAADGKVDVAIVLAVDCSYSVDTAEFALQMLGLGQALQNPEVWAAIRNGPNKRIALMVMEWSDKDSQLVVMPWTVIASPADAVNTGRAMQDLRRDLAEGGTAISRAITFAASQFSVAPPAVRRVIDVSFDGRNNTGPALPQMRNAVVAQGIVINALPITNEFPTLDVYAERQLIGGQGAFAVKANSYEAYGEAILRKLIREIIGPGVS